MQSSTDPAEVSGSRFKDIGRALVISILLCAFFIAGIWDPEKTGSLQSWIYCRWPVYLFYVVCVARFCGWLQWRHLVLSVVSFLVIYQIALTSGVMGEPQLPPQPADLHMPSGAEVEDVETMPPDHSDLQDLNLFVLAMLVLVPGALGIALADWTERVSYTHKPQSQLNPIAGVLGVLGVLLTSVLLGCAFLGGIILFARIGWSNFHAWTHFGWPLLIFGFAFFCALNRRLKWPHLLFSSLLLAAGACSLLSPSGIMSLAHGAYFPESDPGTGALLLALAYFTLTFMLVPGMLGIALGSWADTRANPVKYRRGAALMVIFLLAVSPGIRWTGLKLYAHYYSISAGKLGEAQVRKNVRDLQLTDVVPTLDTKITEGRNLIWCATLQLAWNELRAFAGGDIHMAGEDPSVELLNKGAADKGQFDPATCLVIATNNIDEITTALKTKFHGTAQIPASLPADSWILYSHLVADLPFEWAFDRHPFPFPFKGTPVESFGIGIGNGLIAGQVRIFHMEQKPGFVIELKTRNPKHHLYLASIPPQATLGETVTEALHRVKHGQPHSFHEGSQLFIPIIDFDLTRDYPELTGRPLAAPNFNGRPLHSAIQKIRLKLDERGAFLESSAELSVSVGLPDNFEFNQAFLVILQYADTPYFAAWIDNPELLIKK